MNNQQAINHAQQIPEILQALQKVHGVIDRQNLDRTIYHLVLLRASQINGCGYCIDMHTREAIGDGETSARLDWVANWRQSEVFNARENIAFAWTEALTRLDKPSDLARLRAELREVFSDKEIGLLTANIAMINLWNRIQISGH